MAEELQTELSAELLNQLQSEKLVLLHTIDAETGSPTSNCISWVYAVDAKTIRFAVDKRSRIVGNIEKNEQVALSVFALNTVNELKGKATIKVDALEDVPFKLACIDIELSTLRDTMFYGARISVEPEYEKTYDKRAAEKLDNQVFSAMKKA